MCDLIVWPCLALSIGEMALDASFLQAFEIQLTSRKSHQAYLSMIEKRRLLNADTHDASSFAQHGSSRSSRLPTKLNTSQLFIEIVKASCDIDQDMVRIIRGLRQVGLITAALTNDFRVGGGGGGAGAFSEEISRLESLERLFLDKTLFNVVISSAATGSRKPEGKLLMLVGFAQSICPELLAVGFAHAIHLSGGSLIFCFFPPLHTRCSSCLSNIVAATGQSYKTTRYSLLG